MRHSSIHTQTQLLAPPPVIFDAWLDSASQALITQAPAQIVPRVGGMFSVWDGSVTGEIVFLQRPRRIAQTWRTHDFDMSMDDTRLELTFEPIGATATRLIVEHQRIPAQFHRQFSHAWSQVYFPRFHSFLAMHHSLSN